MKQKIIIAIAALMVSSCMPAFGAGGAGHWGISTNLPTWMLLGTANTEVHYMASEHWSLEAGVKYNPFTYYAGSERQTHLRQLTPSIGARYWFCEPWHGWYAGARLLGSEYSVSWPRSGRFFDGDLAGARLFFGYNFSLTERLSLSLGAGGAAAYHRTTFYAGAVCGRIVDRRSGFALFPSDLTASLMIRL